MSGTLLTQQLLRKWFPRVKIYRPVAMVEALMPVVALILIVRFEAILRLKM